MVGMILSLLFLAAIVGIFVFLLDQTLHNVGLPFARLISLMVYVVSMIAFIRVPLG